MTDAVILSVCVPVVVVLVTGIIAHFRTVASLRKDIHDLELKIKDLEKKDDIQQTVLDNLTGLLPEISEALNRIKEKA